MSEKTVTVRSYRWKDEEPSSNSYYYSGREPKKAEDHAGIFADLWLRVETLRSAEKVVRLTFDKEHLHLQTTVPVPVVEIPAPAPEVARKPAKQARAKKSRKRSRGTGE